MSSNDTGSVLHRGFLVVAVSVLAGLLLAGALFPIVGGFGMLARAGADSFGKLPAELREEPLPQRSKILAADGSTLADIFFNENRILVPISEMPDHLIYSILAIEDARYYEHGGVDVPGLVRAFVRNRQAGTVTQGGSTITQQYVKNVLVENAEDKAGVQKATERSTERKIREARYAIALERRYSKQEILEKYLNIAYFGEGVYGVGTAAQHYFRTPVQKITLGQAALLAGMVKNPQLYNPAVNRKAAKARRDLVLRRTAELALIPQDKVDAAIRKPLPRISQQKLTGIEDNKVAPAFLSYLREYFLNDQRFGETKEERTARLFQGGLVIRTTLDLKLQAAAQQTLAKTLPLPNDPAAAAVVVKPGTGEVKAMAVVSHDKKIEKVNLATGGSTGYQAGSTFKMFTLAAAVEEGLPLKLRIKAPARYRADPKVCDNPESGYFRNAGDSEAGTFDLPTATWMSVNTYFVQLQQRVGVAKVAQMARRMGIDFEPPTTSRECSLTLGAREVSPLDMAAAYATLAAKGKYCAPTPITSVQAPGEDVQVFEPDCAQVLEPDVANTVTSVLRGVIDGRHPHRTGRAASLGRPAAGKTGTTNGPTAAWFDGYTPDFSAAVWMGHPTSPRDHPLRNVHGVRTVYGGGFPAQMWRQIMLAAHVGVPPSDFDEPPATAVFGQQVPVPDLLGLTPEAAERALRALGLSIVVSGQRVPAGPIAAGRIGLQRPSPESTLFKGSTVTVYLSNGQSPPPSPSPTPSPTPSSPSPSPVEPTCHGNPNKCPTPSPSPVTPSGEPPDQEPG